MLRLKAIQRSILNYSALIFLSYLSINNLHALPLGINTNEIMQIDSSVPFVDVFRQTLPFEEADDKLTYGHVRYDQNGWPSNLNGGQAGTNLIHWVPEGTLPAGIYTVLYDGEGTIRYGDDAKLLQSVEGMDKIRIHPGGDKFIKVTLRITKTDPQDYIRNIRVLLPGGICANDIYKRVENQYQCPGNYRDFATHHKSIIFNPDYLRFMKDFKVIRFMNMAGITRNPMSTWDQLPHMDEATWAGKEGKRGAPLEIMVALANKLNKHAWFNMPHAADNQLIKKYALYVRQHLKPHLKIYLEYTNEAWNPTFTHWKHMVQNGRRMNLDRDNNAAGHKYYVKRSLEVFNIWEQIFGGSHRFVRILGGWTPNTKLSELMLAYHGAGKRVDALSIAPYFFVHDKVKQGIRSVPDVFRKMKEDSNPYSVQNVLTMIEKQKAITDKYNISLLAYEGGQHLVSHGTKSTRDYPNPFYIGANRAWPMEKMYVEFLQGWQRITGNKLFVAFSAPRTYQSWGSWGIKEHINQHPSRAPKYRALMQFF